MAGGSGLADTIDEGVGIAIHPDGLDGLDVSGGFAFLPEGLAGARPVMRESTFLRFPEGGFVGIGKHEDGIRVHALRDHRNQATLLVKIKIADTDRFLSLGVRTVGWGNGFFHDF